jgi:hypothetical protein
MTAIDMPGRVVRPQLSRALLDSALDVHAHHAADYCQRCGETDCQIRRHAEHVLRVTLGGFIPAELRDQAAAAVETHRPPFGSIGDLLGQWLGLSCRHCGQLWPCLPYRDAHQVLGTSTDEDLGWLWAELLDTQLLVPADPFQIHRGTSTSEEVPGGRVRS